MQTQTTLKRYALKHIGVMAIGFGILVSSLTAAATLSVTGDLPSISRGGSANVADSGLTPRVTAAAAERLRLHMERDEFAAWRNQWLPGVDSELTTSGQFADAQRRELLMQRSEFSEWLRSRAAR